MTVLIALTAGTFVVETLRLVVSLYFHAKN